MRCRVKHKKPGDIFPVRNSYHYPLPSGLSDGTLVKLIAFDHGYWTVEANGERFTVYMTAVDSGFLYELNGRWYPADDPRVVERKKEETLANSPAYSRVNGGCVNPPSCHMDI